MKHFRYDLTTPTNLAPGQHCIISKIWYLTKYYLMHCWIIFSFSGNYVPVKVETDLVTGLGWVFSYSDTGDRLIGQVLILHLIAADDMLMRQNKSSVELIDLSSNTCFHKVFARNIVLTESAKMDTANIDNWYLNNQQSKHCEIGIGMCTWKHVSLTDMKSNRNILSRW